MDIAHSTNNMLPVVLVSASDYTDVAGITAGDVNAWYWYNNDTTLGALTVSGRWHERGHSEYYISAPSSVVATQGQFGYVVSVTGCAVYRGLYNVTTADSYRKSTFDNRITYVTD